MLKHYCDACGKEITENRQVFTPSYHLIEPNDGLYVDRGFNPVSGRRVEFDLCLRCYNRVMGKAVNEFKEIQKEQEV